jgi:hypothetical protein
LEYGELLIICPAESRKETEESAEDDEPCTKAAVWEVIGCGLWMLCVLASPLVGDSLRVHFGQTKILMEAMIEFNN